MLFGKARRIRELEQENEFLRKENFEQRQQLAEAAVSLKKTLDDLNRKSAEVRRSAFAEEIGLLPCESPACKFCGNAVWYGDADGRHIAGCKKGIQCADFEEREKENEAPAPMPANALTPFPVGIQAISQYYPVSAALGGAFAGGFR